MTDSSIEKALRVAQRCANLAAKVPIAGEPDPLWWERQAALGDAADKINELIALPSPEREPMREALEQANVDILMVLGACRDNMPSEAVEIFQRIAKDCTRAALAPPTAQERDK